MSFFEVPLYELCSRGAKIKLEELTDGLHLNRLHRNDFCQIILLQNGGGKHQVDFKNHLVSKNNIYLIYPYQLHQIELEKSSKGLVLSFSLDFLAQLSINHYSLANIGYLSLDEQEIPVYVDLLESLAVHLNSDTTVDYTIATNYLSIFLLKIIGKNISREPSSICDEVKLFRKFHSSIEANFKRKRTIKDYETELGVTYKKLNEVVKRKTGKTALQLIHDRLLLEIKRLLFHTQLSQKEISYELNFDSAATFNQFVKKQTSLTPAEIRQQLLRG